jgi:apolipoprotein D and lipocalin family protein
MRKTIYSLLALTGVYFIYSQVKKRKKNLPEAPETVAFVDLTKYAGRWYEIAKIPNDFQEDCVRNTTANYSLTEDGKISVLNKCIDKEGKFNEVTGIGIIKDTESNAKLEVSFTNVLGVNLFFGDYWIIGLDENYRYAVVGHPERKYGWILSREPEMSKRDLDNVHSILRNKGYDPSKFQVTEHEFAAAEKEAVKV